MKVTINGKFSRVEATVILSPDGFGRVVETEENGLIKEVEDENGVSLIKQGAFYVFNAPALRTNEKSTRLKLRANSIVKRRDNLYDIRITKKTLLTSMYPYLVNIHNTEFFSRVKNYLVNIYTDKDMEFIYYVILLTGERSSEELETIMEMPENFVERQSISDDIAVFVYKTNEKHKIILSLISRGEYSRIPKDQYLLYLGSLSDPTTYKYWQGVFEKNEELRRDLSDLIGTEIPSGAELHSKPAHLEFIFDADYLRIELNTIMLNPEEPSDKVF